MRNSCRSHIGPNLLPNWQCGSWQVKKWQECAWHYKPDSKLLASEPRTPEMDSNQSGTVKSWQMAFSRSKNIVRAWGATLLLIDGVENCIVHLKKKLCQQWEALKINTNNGVSINNTNFTNLRQDLNKHRYPQLGTRSSNDPKKVLSSKVTFIMK